jgi:tetratricopeptide (TPR) repeat protein
VQRALELAQSGHCPQALPALKTAFAGHLSSKLRLQVGLQALTCAMALNRDDEALPILLPLQKDYPHDPEVLYLATHVYSDLSTLASRALIFYAPGSYQVHELDAESLEVQGEWQKAEGEYRTVLQMDPGLIGIHYRIGRLLLSEPPSSDPAEQQKRLQAAAAEFEAELKIDPRNAGAEFVLGQLARQSGNWQKAVTHFAHAAALNPTFTPALVAEGEARVHVRDYTAALKPLQAAERQQPGNPTPHFLLAQVYQHDGNSSAAGAEFKLYQQTRQAAQKAKDQLQKTLTQGAASPAQR